MCKKSIVYQFVRKLDYNIKLANFDLRISKRTPESIFHREGKNNGLGFVKGAFFGCRNHSMNKQINGVVWLELNEDGEQEIYSDKNFREI